jgi:hypothetical protein
VWQFVITGEVWLQGKKLEAVTVNDWLSAVKWLYTYVEPMGKGEEMPSMVVEVVRVQKPYVNPDAVLGEDDDGEVYHGN